MWFLPLFGGTAASGVTINCTVGTATASGLDAQIDQQLTITAALGTATASGLTANVDRQLTIATSLATAIADGFNANIDRQLAISCSIGQVIADGFLASITFDVAAAYAANGNLYLGIGGDLSIMLGSLGVPSWNTAGRPTGNFKLGYNTTTGKLELYNGVAWVGVTLT